MYSSPKRSNQFARKLFLIKENENRKLARELHDELNQELAAITFKIAFLEKDMPSVGTAQKLASVRSDLERLVQNTRMFARRLHPSIVEDLGLEAALRAECAALRDVISIDVACENVPSPSLEISLCLYRVTQEALRNAINHSGSRDVHVRLWRDGSWLKLNVTDHGRGFDIHAPTTRKGLGLTSMAERVRLIGGDFRLTSTPGKGTSIQASAPLASDSKGPRGMLA